MLNRIRISHIALLLVLLSVISVSFASESHQSGYSGQEDRKIKSLSSKDIEALLSGAGWGLAKPAELNGIPGPLHLLELQTDLDLSDEQVTKIQAIWSSMNKKAIEEGKNYLASEEKIEAFFQTQAKDNLELEKLLNQSSKHLAMLRKIHLSAHLEVLPTLSPHQIKKYNVLRGYQKHTNHSH